MSDNLSRYRAIRDGLRQLYPTEPQGNVARHLDTLAGLISGIVGSSNSQLLAIVAKVPDRRNRESRVKQFARWMSNERIDAKFHEALSASDTSTNECLTLRAWNDALPGHLPRGQGRRATCRS